VTTNLLSGTLEELMKKLMAATVVLSALGSPALADFWIVRESPIGPCSVVANRPNDTRIEVVGGKTYRTRAEAERDMSAACKQSD
jgi:hypothetical protein